MQYDRTVIGYHGCSADVAEAILAGEDFEQSKKEHDWLGRGVYFWEFGLQRAWDWASKNEKSKHSPAVVGAVIQLGNCLDLLDTGFTSMLRVMAPVWAHQLRAAGEQVPENRGLDLKARFLDCALINWTTTFLETLPEQELRTQFQSVRGSFQEGEPVFAGSAILLQSHIQIAVRDPACIIGTFRPSARG